MLVSQKALTSCEKGFGVEKNCFMQQRRAVMIFQKPELHTRLSGLKLDDDAEEGIELVRRCWNGLGFYVARGSLGKR